MSLPLSKNASRLEAIARLKRLKGRIFSSFGVPKGSECESCVLRDQPIFRRDGPCKENFGACRRARDLKRLFYSSQKREAHGVCKVCSSCFLGAPFVASLLLVAMPGVPSSEFAAPDCHQRNSCHQSQLPSDQDLADFDRFNLGQA